jgi:hypothetical protein
MDIKSVIDNYDSFTEKSLFDRFFKHHHVIDLLSKLPTSFEINKLGKSAKGRSINAVKFGKGQNKVMLWSQMHGDEATGTMTLFDLFNFLNQGSELANFITQHCEILAIPMVNPDGAEVFTRRNALQIDINRDYLQLASPESQVLKNCRENFKPHFGFNLHDQNTLWSVDETLKPATLSYLAPAFDKALSVDATRKNAMLVIADMFNHVHALIPQHIGLFDDEHEPRAFGDNFQAAGTSTILIEAGGFVNDPEKQQIRKYYFASILSGLISIATKGYEKQTLANYFAIPKNNKQIFHYIIHNVLQDGIKISVGINYDECPNRDGSGTYKSYSIQDIGDLSYCDAYHTYNAENLTISGEFIFDEKANFNISKKEHIILAFKNGELLQKH